MQTRMVTGPVFAKLLARPAVAGRGEQIEGEHGVIEEAADDLDPLELVKQSIRGFDRKQATPNATRTDKTKARQA